MKVILYESAQEKLEQSGIWLMSVNIDKLSESTGKLLNSIFHQSKEVNDDKDI